MIHASLRIFIVANSIPAIQLALQLGQKIRFARHTRWQKVLHVVFLFIISWAFCFAIINRSVHIKFDFIKSHFAAQLQSLVSVDGSQVWESYYFDLAVVYAAATTAAVTMAMASVKVFTLL